MALRSKRQKFLEELLVMGRTESQCHELLPVRMADYTYANMRTFDSIWIEEWAIDDFGHLGWIPRRFLDCRRWKLRAAAIEQYSSRRKRKR